MHPPYNKTPPNDRLPITPVSQSNDNQDWVTELQRAECDIYCLEQLVKDSHEAIQQLVTLCSDGKRHSLLEVYDAIAPVYDPDSSALVHALTLGPVSSEKQSNELFARVVKAFFCPSLSTGAPLPL